MVTSQTTIRNVLQELMARGIWYTVPELVELARSALVLDSDDRQIRHGELVFRRQVANAAREFRRDSSPVEWNGYQASRSSSGDISSYRIPLDSQLGLSSEEQAESQQDDGAPRRSEISNDGYDAEEYVANRLRADGWIVTNVRNRGFGYDLIARRDSVVMRIEVKSSTSGRARPELTDNEMRAARRLESVYYLATVDNWDGSIGDIQLYRDPANNLDSTESVRIYFVLDRSSGVPEEFSFEEE